MCDRTARELEVDERNVGNRGDDAAARECADPDGGLVQPVAQDREIVGREIPGDADVLLVETEVDPARRDEVEITQFARFDEVAYGNDRGAVEEGVSRHQHQTTTLGELDELE